MLNIFSHACWPSACLFWKNVHSGYLAIFKLKKKFFFMSSLYILDIDCLSDVLSLGNSFFHWVGCLFIWLMVFFTVQKQVSLAQAPFKFVSVLRFPMCPLRAESLCARLLQLSKPALLFRTSLFSKPDILGAYLSSATPGVEARYGAQTPHSLGRICVLMIFLLVSPDSQAHLHPSYTTTCGGSFFLSLVVENLFC